MRDQPRDQYLTIHVNSAWAVMWSVDDSHQAGFRKGRGTGDQIANICWIIEKAREFQKNNCLIDYAKFFDFVGHNKLWKILKEMEYQTTSPASWEIKKQQLELDMEQWTGSKLGNEYIKVQMSIYLTYMHNHHAKCWAGWSTSWSQDCWEK